MSNQMLLSQYIDAILFATKKHQGQTRKDRNHSPYITHPIAVVLVIVEIGKITEPNIIISAILHDTIEDTNTTPKELSQNFGNEVLKIVLEVTDDKSLPKEERKRLQVKHAPDLSYAARIVKWGDKLVNCRDILTNPPEDWPIERRQNYIQWAADVLAQIRDTNPLLEAEFDQMVEEAENELGFKIKGFDSVNERPWGPCA
jgi:guanosine-3',5'-bis(diphosphate) 3'-pyrophosphohydrolase